jgi:hypothetical protein
MIPLNPKKLKMVLWQLIKVKDYEKKIFITKTNSMKILCFFKNRIYYHLKAKIEKQNLNL